MNKTGHKRLGILAGMGPRSTAPFLDLVYDECRRQYGAKDDIDYPEIVVFSWPTPFYVDRPVDDDALEESIRNGLRELCKTDVSVIAMPCNTAHKYFDSLRKSVDVKLLNIIEIASARIASCGIVRPAGKVTVLGTKSTMDTGLYQDSITRHGNEYFFDDGWQAMVNELITGIKSGEGPEATGRKYSELERLVQDEGVETVIFACTDLTVIPERYRRIPVIDSSRELARELIAEYCMIGRAFEPAPKASRISSAGT